MKYLLNICLFVLHQKELICDFRSFDKKSLEIKKHLLHSTERTLPYCKFKIIFKSLGNIVKQLHFKDALPKSCDLVLVVLSVIAVILFTTTKQMSFLRQDIVYE